MKTTFPRCVNTTFSRCVKTTLGSALRPLTLGPKEEGRADTLRPPQPSRRIHGRCGLAAQVAAVLSLAASRCSCFCPGVPGAPEAAWQEGGGPLPEERQHQGQGRAADALWLGQGQGGAGAVVL